MSVIPGPPSFLGAMFQKLFGTFQSLGVVSMEGYIFFNFFCDRIEQIMDIRGLRVEASPPFVKKSIPGHVGEKTYQRVRNE